MRRSNNSGQKYYNEIFTVESGARLLERADREMAIGSAFKLYVLSELVREVGARQRKWTDVVPLDGKIASLSSGMLQSWPGGSPVTLHTLANMMISISDNIAADELLMTPGRQRVEAILPATGHSKPELNVPFLRTLEMFKLKGEPTGQAATAYLALDANGPSRLPRGYHRESQKRGRQTISGRQTGVCGSDRVVRIGYQYVPGDELAATADRRGRDRQADTRD